MAIQSLLIYHPAAPWLISMESQGRTFSLLSPQLWAGAGLGPVQTGTSLSWPRRCSSTSRCLSGATPSVCRCTGNLQGAWISATTLGVTCKIVRHYNFSCLYWFSCPQDPWTPLCRRRGGQRQLQGMNVTSFLCHLNAWYPGWQWWPPDSPGGG